MNQATNLIQWRNLTQEQKDEFDFENYLYEFQGTGKNWYPVTHLDKELGQVVYRLVIETDKWYMCEWNGNSGCELGRDVLEALEEIPVHYHNYRTLRPAKLNEKPKPEKTLEQKIQEKWPRCAIIFIDKVKWHGVDFWGFKKGDKNWSTFEAKGMKGFKGYVFDSAGDLIFSIDCNLNEGNYYHTCRPIAVLFRKVGE
jgi:hypothetical protein